MRLENKKALVTGASRGIGKAIAKRFIAEGAEIWGLGTKEPSDLEKRIEESKGALHWINADLGNLELVEQVIEEAIKDSGGFDILINNAGITKDKLSLIMKIEDFQKVLDVNLSAAFIAARTVGRDMIKKRKGSIINMASVVGIHGNAGQANYSASKAGLIGITKSLALEMASRNVRVNAVAPGFIISDMTGGLGEAVQKAFIDRIPLRRAGMPEDVAEAVLFLASDEAAYITGQVLTVDGGMFM